MPLSLTGPGRAQRPGTLLWPSALVVSLVMAVLWAPFPVASAWVGGGYANRAALVDSLSTGFVEHWATQSGVIDRDLAGPIDFWARFHAVKAVLAALLLIALGLLGRRTFIAYTRAVGAWRRCSIGALAMIEGLLMIVALLVLVANIQGAVAPFSSALGLLPVGAADLALAGTLEQIRGTLAEGVAGPVLQGLVDDFTVYHLAMVALGTIVTVGLVAAAILLWRRRAALSIAPHRGRALLTLAVVAAAALSVFFAVTTVANVSTVAQPAPALLGFFEGAR